MPVIKLGISLAPTNEQKRRWRRIDGKTVKDGAIQIR
jgi:hypothetical protein